MIYYLPFLLQGILMGIDERLHLKRGLGLWERIGHPLDTISVLVPLLFVALNPYTEQSAYLFLAMAIFSCLFITKDEFVHKDLCSKGECFLHALLFIIHPVIFFCTWMLWKNYPSDAFLLYQPMAVGAFLIYQILRWSIPWK